MTVPTNLTPILALPDPDSRLDALTAYIERADTQTTRARQARTEAIRELRARGVTWRVLSDRTGLAEQTCRGLLRERGR